MQPVIKRVKGFLSVSLLFPGMHPQPKSIFTGKVIMSSLCYFLFQSLGCVLYAMCYFKSPFDAVYERGDSVALAAISGNITFPESSPYNSVRSGYVLTPNLLKKTQCLLSVLHNIRDNTVYALYVV